VIAGLLFQLHKYLNKRALNDVVSDTYDWKKEVVVVTGGAGGIGGEIVKELATKGTYIAVLDIMPLTYPKRKYFQMLLEDWLFDQEL